MTTCEGGVVGLCVAVVATGIVLARIDWNKIRRNMRPEPGISSEVFPELTEKTSFVEPGRVLLLAVENVDDDDQVVGVEVDERSRLGWVILQMVEKCREHHVDPKDPLARVIAMPAELMAEGLTPEELNQRSLAQLQTSRNGDIAAVVFTPGVDTGAVFILNAEAFDGHSRGSKLLEQGQLDDAINEFTKINRSVANLQCAVLSTCKSLLETGKDRSSHPRPHYISVTPSQRRRPFYIVATGEGIEGDGS